MKKRALLIETCGKVKPVLPEDKLEKLYELIGCDIIDIAYRKIGNKYYDIVLDDCGLLKDKPIMSTITKSGEPMLCGNLLIFNHEETDDGGQLASLEDSDLANIAKNIVLIHCEEKTSEHTYHAYLTPAVIMDW